jgi:hypothetical protein
MQIQKIDPNRECFNDYSLDGTLLTIGEITLDLEAEEQDQEVIIPFGSCEGMIHRGLKPCCDYVAEVVIPPRRYVVIDVDNEPQTGNEGIGDEPDEEPGTHTENVPVPLDLDSVILKLWPIVDLPDEATAEGEENAE